MEKVIYGNRNVWKQSFMEIESYGNINLRKQSLMEKVIQEIAIYGKQSFTEIVIYENSHLWTIHACRIPAPILKIVL